MTSVHSPATARIQLFIWKHPQWWTVAVSASAWIAMLLAGARAIGHDAHHRMSFAGEIPAWMLMVAAMMLPLVRSSVRVVAVNSLWSRRNRAVAGFLAGFLASWFALGVIAALLRSGSWAHTELAAALAFAVAAFWQRTPLHWRAVAACHRMEPL